MTEEELWGWFSNEELWKVATPEERVALAAARDAYMQATRAEEYAQARLAESNKMMFLATLRLVEDFRRQPEALDDPNSMMCEAGRQHIRQLIEDGQEVTDEFVRELMDIVSRHRRSTPPSSPPPVPPHG